MKRSIVAFLGALLAAFALSTAPALANAGKVLVFTGTGGTLNPSSADAVTAIKALGTANDFTVDNSADKADINATNLANYRAVVFVNSAGDALDAAGETALTDYVNNGGGWVGMGESALLEQGGAAFFNTLTGLTGTRVTGTATASAADLDFPDRVHPSTRSLPLVEKALTETWYTWATNPTGTVHTVARVRGNTLPDGTSVTNDAVSRLTGNNATVQPQLERPASWCRDIQQGRSFYTELGSSAASLANADVQKHLLGAIQWAAGMVRGGCKAGINSNYSATRITPIQTGTNNNLYGEMTKSALADDGRVFYGGRAICYAGYTQITNWDSANTGLGCGTIHVWDPRVAGTNNQNPDKIAMVANLSVFGAHGSSPEYGQNSTSEAGLVGMALDPDFTKGRPYIYVQYYPYFGGEQGKDTTPKLGPGFDRRTYKGEKRISRFTYDEATKKLVPGSEKVIFSYISQVYSCCHNGAGMAFDSKGNLYVTNGDSTPNGTAANGTNNQSNNNNGGYVNPDPHFTLPCPGAAATTHCGDTPADQRPADTGPLISYGDARGTSGNTNVYEGKIIRIHPLANPGDTPGIGSTYTIPDATAPNGANLFPPDSQPVLDGKAKPEIFAMGVRSNYTIHIDKKTDAITTAWIGPDQSSEIPQWGPAKTENATMMNSAGNWGWPFCQAGNRWDYRAKLPTLNGGDPAPFGTPGTVGGGADGQTGGFFDCRGEVQNLSPYNTGLTTIPAPKPVNIWYGPQGGCYGYNKNANGVGLYSANIFTAAPDTFRSCPWLASPGASQAPIDGGIYRKPTGDKPDAWPSYWDGKWFMIDFANAQALRHALLMDPATQFKGGQPVSVDSLFGIVTPQLIGGTRPVFMDFGADGALYVGSYSGGYYAFTNSNLGIWRFAYTGGPDTPGPDPKATVPAVGSTVAFNIGKSGGVSYTWDFGDGTPKVTTQAATVSHTYDSAGAKNATLTVNYADGDTASKAITTDAVATPLFTNVSQQVGADVPLVLSLTLGTPATFGAFTPAIDKDYTASTTARAIATSGDAALTVADPATTSTGFLTNGDYTLASPLQVKATSAVGAGGGTFANVGSSAAPTSLLTYSRSLNDAAITLDFKQHVSVGDALRAGRYSKTLTFTLSTTTP
ncbi:ThuA domain-containing protein [Solirubrobacter ginsenosidimutans]|uniref:ThuA domain-containing protein n=1 Tax=Solirubrobacter ginsenosidimutans TaxID=490573 RepID=A0A9X3MTE5_9ACTN|nr:ThuA domain-containing protein [Solirubrobacter ginsenosidimutans]MDA0160923.1 ThuA domain-containing protein [Solirubrobacter ginsenosidimutans]